MLRDFSDIWNIYPNLLAHLKGSKILITGATGFFGKWLLGAIQYANQNLAGEITVYALSRNPGSFLTLYPQFEDVWTHFIEGDIRTVNLNLERIHFAIHAATEASAMLNSSQPDEMFDVNVHGTKNLLSHCSRMKVGRILITSSGAIYGRQAQGVLNQPESLLTGPEPFSPASAYAEGKRVSEFLGSIHSKKTGQIVNIARCYAYLGPYLPLDTHFAAGNFINDCLKGRPIELKGDGSTIRSYQHPLDLVSWLLTILAKGTGSAYNVGSERAVSTLELAKLISNQFNLITGQAIPVHVLGKASAEQAVDRYVPSTEKARRELGLKTSIDLEETIRRTLTWHLQRD